jgi:hypothetical protein
MIAGLARMAARRRPGDRRRLTDRPTVWRNPGTPMNPHKNSLATAARLWHPWLRIDRMTRALIADRLIHLSPR